MSDMVSKEDAKFIMRQARALEKLIALADLGALSQEICSAIIELDDTLMPEIMIVSKNHGNSAAALMRLTNFIETRIEIRAKGS